MYVSAWVSKDVKNKKEKTKKDPQISLTSLKGHRFDIQVPIKRHDKIMTNKNYDFFLWNSFLTVSLPNYYIFNIPVLGHISSKPHAILHPFLLQLT